MKIFTSFQARHPLLWIIELDLQPAVEFSAERVLIVTHHQQGAVEALEAQRARFSVASARQKLAGLQWMGHGKKFLPWIFILIIDSGFLFYIRCALWHTCFCLDRRSLRNVLV